MAIVNRLLLPLLLPAAVAADTIYVNEKAPDGGDGWSWKSAFNDIQSALLRARSGDEIWVAEGAYYATESTDRKATFLLVDAVEILGGFDGSEERRDERDFIKHRTILSGNIGDRSLPTDNTYRIVSAVNVGPATVLDGFTIREAYNERREERRRGAAIYCENSALTLRNCRMLHNYGGGGGFWNHDGNPSIENCIIKQNETCGILNFSGNMRVADSLIARNRSESSGGGVLENSFTSRSTFHQCIMKRNTAGFRGAGYFGDASSIFHDCAIFKNRCVGGAGSIGAAMFLRGDNTTLLNCTIVGNRCNSFSPGVATFSEFTVIEVKNCLMWGNKAPRDEGEHSQLAFFTGTVDYSNIQGWTGRYGGEGNFGADPKFVGPGRKNLRLAHDSPCMDAGTDDAVTEATDLDGNPRILGRSVDIGAYENLCADVLALSAELVEAAEDDGGGGGGGGRCAGESDGDGLCEPGEDCCLIATVTVNPNTMPEGSTVRVVFTPYDENGNPLEPRVRRARIQDDGRGKATLPDCSAGRVRVCVEGCAENLCREVQCP